ncbi:MAG: homoserine dehydrogenase [Alphaproteobacteria bacterium]|nr:homoserine dehydrogenase [Alphaproteobacteria bacterium]
MSALRIGLAGLGTVGQGVAALLEANGELIARRAGRPIHITAVAARDKGRQRGVKLDVPWVDAGALAARDDVDVVVEVIGGSEGIAKTLCENALKSGKAVVTANKALLAHHGAALAALAEKHQASLAFEAAVAGGIPILQAVQDGLAANRITRVVGILNGTCNYILTAMQESGRPFEGVLAEAQEKGYAEADPSFDIDGVDTAHKLSILASLAFGSPVNFASVSVEGIRRISAEDIAFARELGYVIKLLGVAETGKEGLQQRVHPALVPLDAPLASVNGVFNAVYLEGDPVGKQMFEGRGAGAGPTASAVVSDLIRIARGHVAAPFAIPIAQMQQLPAMPLGRIQRGYYLRLKVIDQPGVLADVTDIFRKTQVSVKSLVQHGRRAGEPVQLVLVTHEAREEAMQSAVKAIAALASVTESPQLIRIEEA